LLTNFVVDLVQRKDLGDVTLVGHSWGGYAITGAASRLEDRLRKLVYWAAFVPVPGKGLIDDVAPEFQAMLARSRRHRAT
jgi:pimeloyl-ACP methyl ester carboxylesterase